MRREEIIKFIQSIPEENLAEFEAVIVDMATKVTESIERKKSFRDGLAFANKNYSNTLRNLVDR